ncbi:MAG: CHAT domain-containing protein [Acidobacteriota bacterium]|nr:CHAT domain-containing protein [Acidobacteriota bacterium]
MATQQILPLEYKKIVLAFGSGATPRSFTVHAQVDFDDEWSHFTLPPDGHEFWGPLKKVAAVLARTVSKRGAPGLGSIQPQTVPREFWPEYQIFGESLGRTVFDRKLQRFIECQYGRLCAPPETGCCLRLQFAKDVGGLANLPWELLLLPDWDGFPALDPLMPIVREATQGGASFRNHPAIEPLHVLVVYYSPKYLEKLGLSEEAQRMEDALDGLAPIRVHFLEGPSLAELRHALVRWPIRALHFMGHGAFDKLSGMGELYFKSAGEEAVDAGSIASCLEGTTVRLVVLNACQYAAAGLNDNPFANVAKALHTAGVRSVVGMQYPVPDRLALIFTETLYSQLADGIPLEAALCEVRRVMKITNPKIPFWAAPVLYGTGGPLLRPAENPAFQDATAPELVRKQGHLYRLANELHLGSATLKEPRGQKPREFARRVLVFLREFARNGTLYFQDNGLVATIKCTELSEMVSRCGSQAFFRQAALFLGHTIVVLPPIQDLARQDSDSLIDSGWLDVFMAELFGFAEAGEQGHLLFLPESLGDPPSFQLGVLPLEQLHTRDPGVGRFQYRRGRGYRYAGTLVIKLPRGGGHGYQAIRQARMQSAQTFKAMVASFADIFGEKARQPPTARSLRQLQAHLATFDEQFADPGSTGHHEDVVLPIAFFGDTHRGISLNTFYQSLGESEYFNFYPVGGPFPESVRRVPFYLRRCLEE